MRTASPLRPGGFFRALLRWLDGPVEERLRRKGRRCPLRLEELEDRRVPVTNFWSAQNIDPPFQPLGGDWDLSTNWSLGHVPTATEDAEIDPPNILITHDTGAADSVNS